MVLKEAYSLAAASSGPTSPLKNRVRDFLDAPSGRTVQDASQVLATASGCITYSYNTASGRALFLQSDPIRFDAGDVNLYRYVGNLVTIGLDPFGLECTYEPTAGPFSRPSGQTRQGTELVRSSVGMGIGLLITEINFLVVEAFYERFTVGIETCTDECGNVTRRSAERVISGGDWRVTSRYRLWARTWFIPGPAFR
jgi:hypothetical protein